MKIAFFDTKPYDKPSFGKYGKEHEVSFKYYEAKLNGDTVELCYRCGAAEDCEDGKFF